MARYWPSTWRLRGPGDSIENLTCLLVSSWDDSSSGWVEERMAICGGWGMGAGPHYRPAGYWWLWRVGRWRCGVAGMCWVGRRVSHRARPLPFWGARTPEGHLRVYLGPICAGGLFSLIFFLKIFFEKRVGQSRNPRRLGIICALDPKGLVGSRPGYGRGWSPVIRATAPPGGTGCIWTGASHDWAAWGGRFDHQTWVGGL